MIWLMVLCCGRIPLWELWINVLVFCFGFLPHDGVAVVGFGMVIWCFVKPLLAVNLSILLHKCCCKFLIIGLIITCKIIAEILSLDCLIITCICLLKILPSSYDLCV